MADARNVNLGLSVVRDMREISPEAVNGSITVYQGAFAKPPYHEMFTDEDAHEALEYLFRQGGSLVLGQLNGDVVSLAGGYFKREGLYYIEELAVAPEQQGRGIGRFTLIGLIEHVSGDGSVAMAIRTKANNHKAISLYETLGFEKDGAIEVVPQMRTNGRITLDQRVHLLKRRGEDMEDIDELKRMVVVYPSGNTTAVVFDQRLELDREEFNNVIMDAWKEQHPDKPEIEQCCFVTLPEDENAIGRVEMFGGEFCGNATRSVIQLLTNGKDYEGTIEASGVDHPLAFTIKDGVIDVEMPLPVGAEANAVDVEEGVLVRLDGIVHLVVTDPKLREEITTRERLNGLFDTNKYGIEQEPAFGVCYFDLDTSKAEFAVWVKKVNTIFDETACGSGTACIGVAVAHLKKSDSNINVMQPSGSGIITKASFDPASKKVTVSKISGTVGYLYDGRFKLV